MPIRFQQSLPRGRKVFAAFALLGGLGLALGNEGEARAADYKYYVWSNDTAECSTAASSLLEAPNMVRAWADKMDDKGWSSGGYLVDGNINLDRFCDPDNGVVSDCTDGTNGVDEGDAVMFTVHGHDAEDWDPADTHHWEGRMRYNGTSDHSCFANSDEDFHAGDSDAEFIHMMSCHSIDDDMTPHTASMLYDPSSGSTRGLILLTGFHGDAIESRSLRGEYKQVAKDGFKSAVADAWLDNLFKTDMTATDPNGVEHVGDQCPVAFAIGDSDSECEGHLLEDQYDSYGSDTSDADWYCYTYVEGCNPIDEHTFNPVD